MTKVTKFFQGSDLQPLTQSLRGEVDPWETLPLNNSPFLTALENPIWPTYGFPCVFHRFSREVWFYHMPRGCAAHATVIFFGVQYPSISHLRLS